MSHQKGGTTGRSIARLRIACLFWTLSPFVLSIPFAIVVKGVNDAFSGQDELSVVITAVFAATISIAILGVYMFASRGRLDPAEVGLVTMTITVTLLIGVYWYFVSFYTLFPADILIWAEEIFVGDILKFREGYPLYSPHANNDSFLYLPGAPLLTYAIAWIVGEPISIVVYRIIQLGYVLLASLIAAACVRMAEEIQGAQEDSRKNLLWGALASAFLFLMATNPVTNTFVHTLHNDALTLLASTAAYWLALRYMWKEERWIIVLMAVMPAIAYLVKQSAGIWALLYSVYFVVFDRRLPWRATVLFAVSTFGCIALVVAGLYVLWGKDFIYWTFVVPGLHPVSPLRSVQHMFEAWSYLAMGLFGGLVLLRGEFRTRLLGAWVMWLALFLVEVYTSGIGWTRSHMGPGSLLAGVWFLAGLRELWLRGISPPEHGRRWKAWVENGTMVMLLVLLLGGLGVVRIPLPSIPDDAYRYVAAIEKEFEGMPAENLLLDAGNWIYLKEGVVMKDRSTPMGDRGLAGIADFSGMIDRLARQRYAKILVRNLHREDFMYDHASWPLPSGIRQALLRNYRETGHIKGVASKPHQWNSFLLNDITILYPVNNE